MRIVYDDTELLTGVENEPQVTGFVITDNGVCFNEVNFRSFITFDTEHKEHKGCKGIGRLLWLKLF